LLLHIEVNHAVELFLVVSTIATHHDALSILSPI
jgi:hypothetical protein